MSTTFTPDADFDAVLAEAVEEDLLDIAADIAAEVEGHYPTVRVGVDEDGVNVTTYGSFDHFKEWGKPGQAPKGYMRSAAAARGGYRPEGK